MNPIPVVALAALLAATPPLAAQAPPLLPPTAFPSLPAPSWQEPPPPRAAPALLSLVVPGSGQLLLRKHRGWAYLALEALGWVAYADRRSEGARYRTRYRDLAWASARLNTEPRVDGDFAYYERLSSWTRSGRFDAESSATGLQPETDLATYNGSVWNRARGIFSVGDDDGPGSPAFEAALAYYRENAYGEAFLWDWTGDPGARDRYDAWIRESDERYREATWALGLLFANHLIAAADAWVSTPASLSLAPATDGAGGFAVGVLLRWELHR